MTLDKLQLKVVGDLGTKKVPKKVSESEAGSGYRCLDRSQILGLCSQCLLLQLFRDAESGKRVLCAGINFFLSCCSRLVSSHLLISTSLNVGCLTLTSATTSSHTYDGVSESTSNFSIEIHTASTFWRTLACFSELVLPRPHRTTHSLTAGGIFSRHGILS